MSAASTRLAFTVMYSRQGTSNRWRVTAKNRPLPEPAVVTVPSQQSGMTWPGQSVADALTATFTMIVDSEGDASADPALLTEMAREAIEKSDRHFKADHPDAIVENGPEE